MLLSQRCEYAIRCALYVAGPGRGAFTAVQEVSAVLGIPNAFLAKLVQSLTRADILRTLRGKNGGIALARPASTVTLKEIVLAVDGPGLFTECLLRLPGCGDLRPCPLHEQWVPVRERIDRMFSADTLATVATDIHANDFRLSSLLDGGADPRR